MLRFLTEQWCAAVVVDKGSAQCVCRKQCCAYQQGAEAVLGLPAGRTSSAGLARRDHKQCWAYQQGAQAVLGLPAGRRSSAGLLIAWLRLGNQTQAEAAFN